MATATVDNIKIVITADTQSAISNLNKVSSSLKTVNETTSKSSKLTDKMKSTLKTIDVALAASLTKVTGYLKDAFNENNDYVEAINLFSVTMGKGANAAQDYANKLQDLMGIDSKEWMNYQGSLNQMMVGFGTGEEQANEMSKQLTQVAYDLSSVWNTDVSEAFHKVQSGMSGQVKGLKTWGINLSVAQLKETALAHGITLSTAKMTEQQKATLRYITIMEKTKNVQGDLARTIVSPANAMRILNNQLAVLKRSIGQIVSVLIAKFIPYIEAAVEAVSKLAQTLAKSFGYKLPDIDYSSMQSLSSTTDSLTENLDSSTDSAKKLKKTLAGFDEINQLADVSDSTSDTSSSLGGGLPGDLGLDLSQYGYDFDGDVIKGEVENVLQSVLAIGGALLFIVGVILTFSGASIPLGIGMMVAGATMMFAAAALSWGEIGDTLAAEITGILVVTGMIAFVIGAILTFGVPAAKTVGIAMMVAGATLMFTAATIEWGGMSEELRQTLVDLMEIVGIAILAIGVLLLVGVPAAKTVGIAMIVAGATMATAAYVLDWAALKNDLENVLLKLMEIVGTALIVVGLILACSGASLPLGIALVAVGAALLVGAAVLEWATLKEKISDLIAKIAAIVGGALIVVGAILCFTAVNIPLGIALLAAGAVSLLIGTGMSEVDWDKLKGKISSIISTMLGIVGKALLVVGALLAFSGIALPLGIALMAAGGVALLTQGAMQVDWDAVPKQIKKVMNGVISWVEKGINKVISLINNFGFSWDVPEWLQKVVGFEKFEVGFSLSKVSIPRLASGGVLKEGQAFIAREAGAELVGNVGSKTAVMNNDQIVESVSNGVYRAMKEAMTETSNDGTTEVNVYLNGEPFYKDFIKRHNAEVRTKGYSPLSV